MAKDTVQNISSRLIAAFVALMGQINPSDQWFMRGGFASGESDAEVGTATGKLGMKGTNPSLAELSQMEPNRLNFKSSTIEFQNQIWEAMQKLSATPKSGPCPRCFFGDERSRYGFRYTTGTAKGTIKWLLNAAREALARSAGKER